MWEMLTLTQPFMGYSYSMLKERVFIEGHRPCVKQVFNKNMAELISSGLRQNPNLRPTMDEVCAKLKSEYIKLVSHTVTEGEVRHDRRRSTFVVKSIGSGRQ